MANSGRHIRYVLLCATLIAAGAAAVSINAGEAPRADKILDTIGVTRGICVLVGVSDATLPIELAKKSELIVYAQCAGAKETATLRAAVEKSGLLNTRVYIGEGGSGRIHLADNLADAVVVVSETSRKEVLRVLRPEGRGIAGDEVIVKPFPEGVDDWSHPYHGPDNNPLSADCVAKAPYRTQFMAVPKFSPMPEQTVAAGGRLFRAHGHIASRANQNEILNTLLAVNGYNGTILWKRPLREGFIIHRNTMIATRDILYLADDESCKLIDTRTGKVRDEIVVPGDISDGPVWKWMALENGILYALVGGAEVRVKTKRSPSPALGHWSWNITRTHNYKDPKTNVGFGRTIVAIDPVTKKVLWNHREKEYIDSRGMCLKNGRLYFYSPGKFLARLDTKQGTVAWKTSDQKLLSAVGPDSPARSPMTGFDTQTYIKCTDSIVFIAGPQRPNLIAISADSGSILWQQENGNRVLVLHKDALYAMGHSRGNGQKLAYDSGKILAGIPGRRGCTRATGTPDSVFFRAAGGTIRIETASDRVWHISPMRPSCQDGVIATGGLLHWQPWMCGCKLALYGHICLGPAGNTALPDVATRLEPGEGNAAAVERIEAHPSDWPAYRGDNERTSVRTLTTPPGETLHWTFTPRVASVSTAPIAAGGMVFAADDAGIVRALDADDGKLRWKAYTGGKIVFPPAFWKGRVYVGSTDGWVYAFEAASGRRLWRFRAAPVERIIPVYGTLMSTWPVAGGVLVENGVVYAPAGIAHYDGTHVYALDAITGIVKWHNDSSGMLTEKPGSGISLQSNVYLENNELRFRGGGVYTWARYDLKSGKCLNKPLSWTRSASQNVFYAYYPEYRQHALLRHVLPDKRVLRYNAGKDDGKAMLAGPSLTGPSPIDNRGREKRGPVVWKRGWNCRSFIVGKDTFLAAGRTDLRKKDPGAELFAVTIEDGTPIWTRPLPAMPVRWGMAMDHGGNIYLSFEDGKIVCYAGKQ